MCSALADVGFGPKADMPVLLNHLVSALLKRQRDVQPERFRGLEIDYHLVLVRRLNWHVGWLLTLEDTVDIASGSAVWIDRARPIGKQAAGGNEGPIVVDRGQLVACRQRYDQIAMNEGWPAGGHDQTPAIRSAVNNL